MSYKYYYKSTPLNPNKIFKPNNIPTNILTPHNIITIYSYDNNLGTKIIKNAPASFYKNSGGGRSPVILSTQPNKYQIFIDNVNSRIFSNGINSTNINYFIGEIQKNINTLISEDPKYLTNPYYIAMMLLIKYLDYEYTINILKEDIQNMTIQLTTLIQENNEYKLYCVCNRRNMYVPGEQHGIVANASIAMEYIKYIELYGVPDDGIFLPSLLYDIKQTYNL
jgi:hypothetical protein